MNWTVYQTLFYSIYPSYTPDIRAEKKDLNSMKMGDSGPCIYVIVSSPPEERL